MHPKPEALLKRSKELKILAESIKCDKAKKELLRCAEEYENWAKRLEPSTA